MTPYYIYVGQYYYGIGLQIKNNSLEKILYTPNTMWYIDNLNGAIQTVPNYDHRDWDDYLYSLDPTMDHIESLNLSSSIDILTY